MAGPEVFGRHRQPVAPQLPGGPCRVWDGLTTRPDPRYAGYRYPAEAIATAIWLYFLWLYFRIPPSLRMVEEMLAARGITVSQETARQWSRKFGVEIATRLRRRTPRRGDKWPLDEVVQTIAGRKHYLWRAVDQDGFVLDALVQSRRDAKSAKRLLRKLLKRQGRAPRVRVTGKLKSYAAAKRELVMGGERRQHKGLNNRAGNSHQPTRRRERQRKRFRSAVQVQRFLSIHDRIANLFHLQRDHRPVAEYRGARTQAFQVWAEVAGAPLAV